MGNLHFYYNIDIPTYKRVENYSGPKNEIKNIW